MEQGGKTSSNAEIINVIGKVKGKRRGRLVCTKMKNICLVGGKVTKEVISEVFHEVSKNNTSFMVAEFVAKIIGSEVRTPSTDSEEMRDSDNVANLKTACLDEIKSMKT